MDLLNNLESRALFINKTLEFLNKYKFDGLDITFPEINKPIQSKSYKLLFTSFIKVYINIYL
jgi:GH18 family chitinase